MDVKDALIAYKIIGEYALRGRTHALGGYPSLVMQGILKEDRQTKDIDMALFSNSIDDNSVNDVSLQENISRECRMFAKVFPEEAKYLVRFSTRGIASAYSGRSKNRKSRGIADAAIEDQSQELIKLGVNKSSSLILSVSSPQTKEQEIRRGKGIMEQIRESEPHVYTSVSRDPNHVNPVLNWDDFYQSSFSGYMSGPTGLSGSSGYTFSFSPPSPPVRPWTKEEAQEWVTIYTKYESAMEAAMNKPTIEKLEMLLISMNTIESQIAKKLASSELMGEARATIEFRQAILNVDKETVRAQLHVMKNYVKATVSTFFLENSSKKIWDLSEFFKRNLLEELKIDIFALNAAKRDSMSIMVDGTRCVHYYLILKAKYEYCKNIATDQESFDKHLGDLINSYSAKRIMGINYPEDIERLVENRINSAK